MGGMGHQLRRVHPGESRAMRVLIYAALMAMLTPLILLGSVFYIVPVLASRGRVSGTAYVPFRTRVFYHLTGSRPDPAALTLAAGLPATNRVVMVLLMRTLLWGLGIIVSKFFPKFYRPF